MLAHREMEGHRVKREMISAAEAGGPSSPASDSSSGSPSVIVLSDDEPGGMPSEDDQALLFSLGSMECDSPPPSPGCVCLGSPTIWERGAASAVAHTVAGGDRSGSPGDVESSRCRSEQPRVSNKSSSAFQVMSAGTNLAPSCSMGDGNRPEPHTVAGGDRSGSPHTVVFASSGRVNKQPRVSSSDLQVLSPATCSKANENLGIRFVGEVPPYPGPELHAASGEITGIGEMKGHKGKSVDIPNHGIVYQNATASTSLDARVLPTPFTKSEPELHAVPSETTDGGGLKGHKRKPEDIPDQVVVNENAASGTTLQVRKLPASLTKSQALDQGATEAPAPSDHLPSTLMDCLNILTSHRKPKDDMPSLAGMNFLEVLKLKGVDLLPPKRPSKKP